jgi:cell division protein FtsL
MRLHGLLTAFAAMLLLAAMFVAVHRGARGHEIATRLSELSDRREAAEVQRGELESRLAYLRSRSRIGRVAGRLGLHTPSGEELVYLDLRRLPARSSGGSR